MEAHNKTSIDILVQQVLASGEVALTDASGLRAAARKLALSPRTLQRRLNEAGVSFRGLDDAEKKVRVLALLRDTQQGLEEVAKTTAFGNGRALIRAVRRWTGMTPGGYRASHRAQSQASITVPPVSQVRTADGSDADAAPQSRVFVQNQGAIVPAVVTSAW